MQYFNFIFRTKKYDLVFDCEPYLNLSAVLGFLKGKYKVGFSNQWRSRLYNKAVKFDKKQHMVQNYLDMLRALGFKYNTNELERLDVKKETRNKIKKYLKKNKLSGLVIGITPGVAESAKSRAWFSNRFAKLADKLILELKAKIIFIDSKKNKKVVHKIVSLMDEKAVNASGLFNLEETFYLIEKCKVFISNDTGPMHIAAAQGCRTIGLFGPNTPVLWGPYGKKNKAIYKTKLRPSIQNDKGIFPDKNRKEYMGSIDVDDVFKEVKKLV